MKKKIIFVIAMCLIATSLQTGCGGASKDSMVMEEAAAVAPMEEMFYDDSAMGAITSTVEMNLEKGEVYEESETPKSESSVTNERKLIKTVNLNLETENYDSLMEGLEAEISRLGGYIEYKDAYHGDYTSQSKGYHNRHANITARIPAKKLEEFTGNVAIIGNITYESESVEDVSLQYVDLSSHKKMLLTEQERLIELLENATTMEDIIAIESRLSQVRYQIESMESQLRTFDNQVDYSTVHINVREVEHYTPQPEKSTWDRIKIGFGENVYLVTNGLKNFVIEFVIAIPVILVWVAVIVLVICLGHFVIKKKVKANVLKKAKKQNMLQCEMEQQKDDEK